MINAKFDESLDVDSFVNEQNTFEEFEKLKPYLPVNTCDGSESVITFRDLTDSMVVKNKFNTFVNHLCSSKSKKERTRLSKVWINGKLDWLINPNTKKPFVALESCSSIFCNDKDCIAHRISLFKKYYRSLFYLNACDWNSDKNCYVTNDSKLVKYGKKFHISLNLPYVDSFKKNDVKNIIINTRKFLKEFQVLVNASNFYDTSISAVFIHDLVMNDNKVRHHVHIALDLFNGFNQFFYVNGSKYDAFIALCSKFGFIYRNHGLKSSVSKINSLINYFAKRRAGVYHTRMNELNKFTLQDVMQPKEFFNTFRGVRRSGLFNIPGKDTKSIDKFHKVMNRCIDQALLEDFILGSDGRSPSVIQYYYDFINALNCLNLSLSDVVWVRDYGLWGDPPG